MVVFDENDIHGMISKFHRSNIPHDSKLLAEYALCIILEVNKWDGRFEPITKHGYVTEKLGKLNARFESMKEVVENDSPTNNVRP